MFVLLLLLVYPYRVANEQYRRVLMWVLFGLFTLFFGLRGNVGDDYSHYLAIYEHPEFHFLTMPAFALAIALFKALLIPFHGFLFACSLVINGLLFRFLVRRKFNLPFALSLFLGFSGVVNEIDFVRNSISILLFANSWEYLSRREVRKYLVVNIVGTLFHYSALLYLPFYFFVRRELPRRVFLGIVLAGIVLFILRPPFLDLIPCLLASDSDTTSHLYTYINTYTREMGFTIASVERLLTAAVVFCLYERLNEVELGRYAIVAFLMFFVCYSLFSNYAVLGTRLANLFVPCYWMLWPALFLCMEARSAKAAAALSMSSYMVIRLVSLNSMPQWHYNTLWS